MPASQAKGALRRFRLALRVAMLSLAVLFALVGSSRSADAAEKVPMCGELGQSIEAPPPQFPARGDMLFASPCSAASKSVTKGDTAPPLRDVAPAPSGERDMALFAPVALPRVPSVRLDVPCPDWEEQRPGFTRELERPPR